VVDAPPAEPGAVRLLRAQQPVDAAVARHPRGVREHLHHVRGDVRRRRVRSPRRSRRTAACGPARGCCPRRTRPSRRRCWPSPPPRRRRGRRRHAPVRARGGPAAGPAQREHDLAVSSTSG
jgi:hypothetical protein